MLMIIEGILKLCLLTTKNRQPISVIFKYLLADNFVPVFYLWGKYELYFIFYKLHSSKHYAAAKN